MESVKFDTLFYSAYLETHFDDDLKKETDRLLFDLWIRLMNSGPGSSHLEMMDIVLKYPHYPLWRYMQVSQVSYILQI